MIEITEKEISIEELMRRAKRQDCGAVVSFLGTVRCDGVEGMEVEAYPEAAVPELQKIRDAAMARFDVRCVDIVHRIGSMSVGDDITLIVCAAPHRKEAFEACSFVLEELKKRVPIWKKEIRKEGDVWVGS